MELHVLPYLHQFRYLSQQRRQGTLHCICTQGSIDLMSNIEKANAFSEAE